MQVVSFIPAVAHSCAVVDPSEQNVWLGERQQSQQDGGVKQVFWQSERQTACPESESDPQLAKHASSCSVADTQAVILIPGEPHNEEMVAGQQGLSKQLLVLSLLMHVL